ncbi:hypothetical protein GCM10010873_07040 [Cypionkella aquatica]|uniref:Uncharacterized protein n=1 Tax=Cypionkella aquatica TaxID=1756042 RepID=A0AA37X0E6_9RHOB|nr:hypothetical protein [Cypionkella aquatica]GLS85730.1 hypothetical protein GCM10010873_07040 [Cypionkella aquatica]
MLGILAAAFGYATRTDTRSSRERIAAQRRWEEEYFWQGRTTLPRDGSGD